jgi:hypothetical protein
MMNRGGSTAGRLFIGFFAFLCETFARFAVNVACGFTQDVYLTTSVLPPRCAKERKEVTIVISACARNIYNGPPSMKTPSHKLAHFLIGKSIAETLIVGALAVGTFINFAPPTFHGWAEITSNGIAGWAVNDASPWERVEVQLFIDDQFIASQIANQPRPDVATAGWAKDMWHGYEFKVPPLATKSHIAYIYALHSSAGDHRKSLQMLDRIIFDVGTDGHLIWDLEL